MKRRRSIIKHFFTCIKLHFFCCFMFKAETHKDNRASILLLISRKSFYYQILISFLLFYFLPFFSQPKHDNHRDYLGFTFRFMCIAAMIPSFYDMYMEINQFNFSFRFNFNIFACFPLSQQTFFFRPTIKVYGINFDMFL